MTQEQFQEHVIESLTNLEQRMSDLEQRMSDLEQRMSTSDQLLMILVSDAVRDQIRKDDLYPFATDEQKVETAVQRAVQRIIERQNRLSKMIIDQLDK